MCLNVAICYKPMTLLHNMLLANCRTKSLKTILRNHDNLCVQNLILVICCFYFYCFQLLLLFMLFMSSILQDLFIQQKKEGKLWWWCDPHSKNKMIQIHSHYRNCCKGKKKIFLIYWILFYNWLNIRNF